MVAGCVKSKGVTKSGTRGDLTVRTGQGFLSLFPSSGMAIKESHQEITQPTFGTSLMTAIDIHRSHVVHRPSLPDQRPILVQVT